MAKYGQNPELRVSCKSFAPRSGGRIVFCICSALALLCDFDIAMRIALSPCALPVRNIGATMAYFALRGIKKDILSSLPVASHGRNLNFIPLFLGYCFPIYFFFGIPSPTLPKSLASILEHWCRKYVVAPSVGCQTAMQDFHSYTTCSRQSLNEDAQRGPDFAF